MRDPFAKDCRCVTHDGPHWLHMDEMERGQASALLARVRERTQSPLDIFDGAVLTGAMREIAEMEERRLSAKLAKMQALGIDSIPEEVTDLVRSSHARWVAENGQRARDEAETRLTAAATEYEYAPADRREALRAEIAGLQQRIRSSEKALVHA